MRFLENEFLIRVLLWLLGNRETLEDYEDLLRHRIVAGLRERVAVVLALAVSIGIVGCTIALVRSQAFVRAPFEVTVAIPMVAYYLYLLLLVGLGLIIAIPVQKVRFLVDALTPTPLPSRMQPCLMRSQLLVPFTLALVVATVGVTLVLVVTAALRRESIRFSELGFVELVVLGLLLPPFCGLLAFHNTRHLYSRAISLFAVRSPALWHTKTMRLVLSVLWVVIVQHFIICLVIGSVASLLYAGVGHVVEDRWDNRVIVISLFVTTAIGSFLLAVEILSIYMNDRLNDDDHLFTMEVEVWMAGADLADIDDYEARRQALPDRVEYYAKLQRQIREAEMLDGRGKASGDDTAG